jgi:hypothetical protein
VLGSSAAMEIFPFSIISSRRSTSVNPCSNGYLGP